MSKILAILLAVSFAASACAAPVQPVSQRAEFIDSVNRSCHGSVNAAEVFDAMPEASKQDPRLLAKFDNICNKFIGLESN